MDIGHSSSFFCFRISGEGFWFPTLPLQPSALNRFSAHVSRLTPHDSFILTFAVRVPPARMPFTRSYRVSQVVDPAHVDGNEIDLDVVREILSHFTFHDFQEAQELILGALMEVNRQFGWVSLEAAKIVADHFGTSEHRLYALLTFYADFRTQPRGKHFMLLC